MQGTWPGQPMHLRTPAIDKLTSSAPCQLFLNNVYKINNVICCTEKTHQYSNSVMSPSVYLCSQRIIAHCSVTFSVQNVCIFGQILVYLQFASMLEQNVHTVFTVYSTWLTIGTFRDLCDVINSWYRWF